jgi:hypothetical protein
MELTRDLYETGSCADFYDRVDLFSGHAIAEGFSRVSPFESEVLINRKWFEQEIAAQITFRSSGPVEVINVTAGTSPLAPDLLRTCGDRVACVYEDDLAGIAEKHELYEELAHELAGLIECRTVAITARTFTSPPSDRRPFVAVPEGIRCYHRKEQLEQLDAVISSQGKGTVNIIIDNIVPAEMIAPERRRIPEAFFREIYRVCHGTYYRRYTTTEIEKLLSQGWLGTCRTTCMSDIEVARTGIRIYFPVPRDGWSTVTYRTGA